MVSLSALISYRCHQDLPQKNARERCMLVEEGRRRNNRDRISELMVRYDCLDRRGLQHNTKQWCTAIRLHDNNLSESEILLIRGPQTCSTPPRVSNLTPVYTSTQSLVVETLTTT